MNARTYLKRKIAIFLSILIFTFSVYCQAPKVKFGKPGLDELQMTVYSKDSGAVAVVLYDHGEFNTNDFTFERHTKVKILKKEGFSWANAQFPSNQGYFVKGFTHNLENGQIVSTKLEKDQIFPVEYAKGRYIVKFTMPNVKVGSVIEYRINYPGIPNNWNFQLPIPVIWSELYMPESIYFTFNKTTYGYENIRTMGDNHWYASDVAGIKEEPYLTTIYNFVSKMEFEIMNVSIPGYYKSYSDTWDNVNKLLSEDEDFGDKMKTTLYMRKLISEIEDKNLPPYLRMKYAYEAIQKHMKWNENNYIYSTKYMGDAYKEHSGNTAEINLMLIALLRDLKLNVNPVVLSTRDNGFLHPAHPTLNKFNYVIAKVQIDTMSYLLDATDPLLPVGLLPLRCLNGSGRFIDIKNVTGDWCSLAPKIGASTVTFMDLKINNQGEITGKIQKEHKGYAAHNLREEIQDAAGIDKFIEEYQTDNKGLKIKSYTIDNLDSLNKSVKSQYDVEMLENSIVTSDKIFFNPLFFEQITENPFKSENRTYPVDFGYNRDKICVVKVEIPQGYAISELPKTVIFKSPDNSLKYTYTVTNIGNVINFTCKMNISKTVFLPQDYAVLKEIYNQIFAKNAEQVVLKKI